ncbi:MAG: hypothetical protein KVP17_003898 [Porospora cf. gigantea B]|uniref:uncharacterized protein n=1 Tax=Porospora cf. gigantea B TaxID=2853592 RepID=UPI003571DD5F|nr:MAG: hypothetical protein KVP17_003898 [Porospora cf. gigantea B]
MSPRYRVVPEVQVKRHPITNALIKSNRPIPEHLRNSEEPFIDSPRDSPRTLDKSSSPREWPDKHLMLLEDD